MKHVSYLVGALLLLLPTTALAQSTDSGLSTCGNGQLDFGEACDGTHLAGSTCASMTMGALPGGSLSCTPDCQTIITTGCNGTAPPIVDSGAGGATGAGGAGGAFGTGGTVTGIRDAGVPPSGSTGGTSGAVGDAAAVAAGGVASDPGAGGVASDTGGQSGTGFDAGAFRIGSKDEGGCGCRLVAPSETRERGAALGALALASLVAARRKRR